MERTLPEATQRPWRHRSRSSGQHPAAHYQCLDVISTMDEMARPLAGLKDGKAPGGDGITAEVWKQGGDNLFSRLHQLIIYACTTSMEECQHCNLSTRMVMEQTVGTIEESLFFPQQTIYPYNTRGSSGDTL